MLRQRNGRPRLLVVDLGLGPQATWYLPRLRSDYDVHVVWLATGNEARDDARAAMFRDELSDGAHTAVFDDQRMRQSILAAAAAWPPDGIATLCGDSVVADVHAICHFLGLPGNDPVSLPALHDKYAQRTMLCKAGIPVPEFAAVDSHESLTAALDRVGRPAILKPVAGSGSVATFRIDVDTDTTRIWAQAGEDARFILEQLLVGRPRQAGTRYGCQVSVESVVRDGEALHLAVTDKLPLMDFREVADIMPSTLPEAERDELRTATTAALRALGITNSVTHTEFMVTEDGPRLIEVNSRIGGGVAQLLHNSHDYDIIGAIAAVATGREVPRPGPPKRFAALLTPQAPPDAGRLVAVPAPEELQRLRGVTDASVPVSIGDVPDTAAGTKGGMLAYLAAVADEPDTLIDLAAMLASDRFFRFDSHTPDP